MADTTKDPEVNWDELRPQLIKMALELGPLVVFFIVNSRADIFGKRAGVTGLVMTKLDGTARGGILVAIAKKFGLPVHFIGVGEGIDNLEPFAAADFARAIVGEV
jgi:signal recognition particle GTPase